MLADTLVVSRWCVDQPVGRRVGGIGLFTFTNFAIKTNHEKSQHFEGHFQVRVKTYKASINNVTNSKNTNVMNGRL